ncbi:MAG: hypothetical protein AAF602_27915, partial [Myxococcota bacterium]
MWTTLLTSLAAGATFEDHVRAARTDGPVAQMGDQDLTIARHRVGQSVSRLLPQISASETQTWRFNNPERYTFSFGSEEDCDDQTSPFCLPVAIGNGQISLPENTLANSLGLTGVVPISSAAITGVVQQRLAQQR